MRILLPLLLLLALAPCAAAQVRLRGEVLHPRVYVFGIRHRIFLLPATRTKVDAPLALEPVRIPLRGLDLLASFDGDSVHLRFVRQRDSALLLHTSNWARYWEPTSLEVEGHEVRLRLDGSG